MDATIRISTGSLGGAVENGIVRFLGIPYALPPFGERRYALPEPVPAWDGVRPASALGPTAPQSPYPGEIGKLLDSVEIPGDDILTLNVWAPQGVKDAPVMVWFHGGAFERGTSAMPVYDGTPFARDGIVYVSVNYRLGAEGFAVLDDAPRNLGLADAAAALEWVHREIGAFGGDAARITIFGQSAGGSIVAALLARPDSRALVAGAIVQSGPLDVEGPAKAGRSTRALAKALGIPTTRAAFAAVPPERLIAERGRIAAGSSPLRGQPGYALTIDERTLPESPREALRDADLPLLIGSTTDEYRLWFTPEALAKIGRGTLALASVALRLPRSLWRAYEECFPASSPGERLGQAATDRLLREPAVDVARTRTSPTYVYEFEWSSPVRNLRAAHAMELGFVFDALDTPTAHRMAGTEAPEALARRMHADWVAFATTGTPGWPAFEGARGTVMRYGTTSETTELPRAEPIEILSAVRASRRGR